MNNADLIRLVDQLEEKAAIYVTLEQVEAAAGQSVAAAVAEGILLVDYRTLVDGSQLVVCRLNRHHPQVAQLTGW